MSKTFHFDTNLYIKIQSERRKLNLPVDIDVQINDHQLIGKKLIATGPYSEKYMQVEMIVSVHKMWHLGWYIVLHTENDKVLWENIDCKDKRINEKIVENRYKFNLEE